MGHTYQEKNLSIASFSNTQHSQGTTGALAGSWTGHEGRILSQETVQTANKHSMML